MEYSDNDSDIGDFTDVEDAPMSDAITFYDSSGMNLRNRER